MGKVCWLCDCDEEVLLENDLCFAVMDGAPATLGHTLVVPRRHIENIFDATDAELIAMRDLIKNRLEQIKQNDESVEGYNIGVNCGISAGQTTPHLHIHIIPRRKGDIENPTGGVRGAIPKNMHEVME